MRTLQEIYQNKCDTPGDINEHLPVLKKYTEDCETVVEFGVRSIVSTWAFLMGNPKKLVSVDYKHPSEYGSSDLEIVENIAKERSIDFSFILSDSRTCEIEPCDLLFIDTLHTYDQIKEELRVHASKVMKYIIFHDTVTFRMNGEINGEVGIWPAIEEFLEENPQWKVHQVLQNNNGLTIIKRD